MNKDQKDTKEHTKQRKREGERERDDRKEVKIIIPLPFPCEVTATVMYNPGSGKLIR